MMRVLISLILSTVAFLFTQQAAIWAGASGHSSNMYGLAVACVALTACLVVLARQGGERLEN